MLGIRARANRHGPDRQNLRPKKTLSELDRQELRKEEILLTKQRDRLFKKIETIAGDKQKIFQQGATQKSPELRKALAQDFELKTQEQLMAARELNLRSKELLTVSRLRMVKENNEQRPGAGPAEPDRQGRREDQRLDRGRRGHAGHVPGAARRDPGAGRAGRQGRARRRRPDAAPARS